MAALSRRDIEMIFRADTDKATRPIAELGKAVKASRGLLEDLASQASTTEGTLDRLGDTTRDLKKAQDELGSARSLLTALNTQNAALEKAEAKVESTGAKYRELADRVAAAEKPTRTLTNSMNAAERAFNAAQEDLSRVSAEAAQTREQIEGIIGPVANVEGAFRDIANTSKEIARGLALAGETADQFKVKLAAAAAANAKLDSDVGFEQQGRAAGLLQSQIDYISQFENRVELLSQAKRELATQNAAFDAALTAQEAKVGAANVDELRRSIAATFAENDRVKQLTLFRNIADDAQAAIQDVTRFGVAEDATLASTNRFAASLRDILEPGRASKATIEGISNSIAEASTVLDGKGRRSLSDYNVALNELISSGAGIGRIAQQIDAFKEQEQAVARAAAAFRDAQGEASKLAADLATVDAPTQEMANALKKAEANVTTAGNAMQLEGTKAQDMGNALKQAGVDVKNLAAAEELLTQKAREAAAAQAGINGKASGKAGGGLFGLGVQDATNLSYQLNDIFTQLASGQSIFITLAQQGPQIWQIEGIKAYASQLSGILLPIAGVVAGLGLVAGAVYGVYKATSPNAQTQAFEAYLASLGEKSTTSAAALGNAATELEKFGAKTDEAFAIVKQFEEAGLDPAYLETYSTALKNAAQVTGTDMKDASTALTEALTGGYDAVVKLNDQYPVLSDAELENIRIMYESGKADEARQLIFDRFTAKYQEAADKMNGGWSNAWTNLKNAAEVFGGYVAKGLSIVLSNLRKNLDEVAVGINYLLLRMQGFDAKTAGIAAVNGGAPPPKNPKPQGRIGAGQPKTTAQGQAAIAEAERELDVRKRLTAEQRKSNAAQDARAKALNAKFSPAEAERLAQLASAKEGRAIADEQAKAGARNAKKAATDRNKAAREAESLANKIESQAEALESALDAMGVKVAKISAGTLKDQLADAADAVTKQYAAQLRKLDDFAKLTGGRGKIGNQSIDQYRESVKANSTILTQQAQLGVYEKNVNDTIAARKSLLAGIEDRAARREITSAQAIKETQEVTSKYQPIIDSLTKAAIDFAVSVGGASPSAEMQAFIEKMRNTQTRTAGDTQSDNSKEAMSRINDEEGKLNAIISQRNALVDSYNTLQQLGLLTADEARKKSAAAYNASKLAITEQSAALTATLDAAKGSIDPMVYDTLIAKLKAIGAEADYLDPRFAQLKQGIDGIISQNAVDGILSIVEGFAKAAAGTQSWGDALANAGLAIVNFIGQTLLMIGKLILQMLVLAAVQAATGIPVAALLGAMNGGGGKGGGGGGFSLFGLKLFHGGGEVGNSLGGQQRTNRSITVSPATLAAAPRYHDGTPGVGLKPQEQIAVLEKGEKVLTEEQQRREAAGKQAGSAGKRGLRQVLAFGDDQVAAAMAGPAGEDVTVTHLRRNAPLLKQLIQD